VPPAPSKTRCVSGLQYGCSRGSRYLHGPSFVLQIFPANHRKKDVDPTRLELVTSAMRERRGWSCCVLPCPRIWRIHWGFGDLGSSRSLFCSAPFWPGCCTVAAHKVRTAGSESATVTFVGLQAKGHRLTPGATQGQNGTLTMVCTREGSGRMLDMVVVPLWHLSRSLVYPSRLRSLV
jgi:hypothetical protein